jgi:hypothetical protein
VMVVHTCVYVFICTFMCFTHELLCDTEWWLTWSILFCGM